MREWIEISDLIVDYDPASLARRPVRRRAVIERLRRAGQRWGARIVRRLKVDAQGVLDPVEVDRVLLSCHAEIQRLHEESDQGRRTLALLGPMIEVARARGLLPVRVVDVGWGIGLAHLMLLLIALAVAGALLVTPASEALVEALTLVARRMLLVYGGYALCVAATFGVFALPVPDLRAFVTLGVFGVLTLLRPWVILAGAAWAAWPITQPEALAAVAVIALTMAPLQWVMARTGVNTFDWYFAFEERS